MMYVLEKQKPRTETGASAPAPRPALGLLSVVYGWVLVPLLIGLASAGQSENGNPPSFRDKVAPILVKKCVGCHNDRKASGGLSLARFASLKRGGKMAGEAILEPGDPESSYLIEVVSPGATPRMPYKRPPLSDDEIRTLSRWVKAGAKYDGPHGEAAPLSSYVDVVGDLPRVALAAPAADPIAAAAFSRDGRMLAAGAGSTVLLHDVSTGKALGALSGHPGPITSVSFTADGASLVAAGGRPAQFGFVTVWELAGRKKRYEVRAHSDVILAAALDPRGARLATGGYDRQVFIWDLAAGKTVSALKDHSDAVYGLAFSPDGSVLASCAADRTVKLWEPPTGKRTDTLSESSAELYSVVFTPDGARLFAAGVDRSIRVWRVRAGHAALERSIFAHDAPILRLAISADGGLLASSAQDRSVRLWKPDSLTAAGVLPEQADWVQALAFNPDGARLAIGRYDGFLGLWDTSARKMLTALREPPAPKPAAAPALVRDATLDPPSPRGGARGSRLRLTLTGQGAGRASRLIIPEPGLQGTIVPASQPNENRIQVELAIAPDARVGTHRIGIITPLGIPDYQTFVVDADPEVAEKEPNDSDPARNDKTPAQLVRLPATLLGTIDRPGDIDTFSFEAKAGQQLVFRVLARASGSALRPIVTVLDQKGETLARALPGAADDPILVHAVKNDARLTLRVEDADFSGSGSHFYRIAAGALPHVSAVFPLGVERGKSARIALIGVNLGSAHPATLDVPSATPAGSIFTVPISVAGGREPSGPRTVVVADGPQFIEKAPSDTPSQALELPVPSGVSGHIERAGEADLYRFRARKGQRVIVEIYGRRLGSPLDSALEILDAAGAPVPRAVLRPVDSTEVAFRDHNSTGVGIRLTHWETLAINDYLFFGRELARIQALPRNPDDDCIFWGEGGVRLGMLETTPEHHPIGQRMYKVDILPPGTASPPSGVPVTTLFYANDDGGPACGKDSRLTFEAPADGSYFVRVRDVRGASGPRFSYHLVLRPPHPSFRLSLDTENPNVPRGGTELVGLSLARLDGFNAPVEIKALDLPPGVTATPALIDGEELSGVLALTADASAPAFSAPTWRLVARALPNSAAVHSTRLPAERQEIDPGGPSGGWITVIPRPNLDVVAHPRRVEIHPGQRVSMTLSVERSPAFKGRVPIDVKNLPQGVRVLNIGLNGVLITEAQRERSVFIYAEPWARAMHRPFYAVGKAEAAGTEHSSTPIELVVSPTPPGAPAQAAFSGR
jgi:WD40 repeat protein